MQSKYVNIHICYYDYTLLGMLLLITILILNHHAQQHLFFSPTTGEKDQYALDLSSYFGMLKNIGKTERSLEKKMDMKESTRHSSALGCAVAPWI